MADKEKKAAQGSEVDKAATDESKAAAKVAKAAKGESKKSNKPNFFARAGKSTKDFFKNFKGETKKIVWPDAKTVLKSTGVVILVVAVVAIIIFGIDQGLSAGVTGLKSLANSDETTTSDVSGSESEEEHDHDHDEDEEEAETSEESSSEEESTSGEAESEESSSTEAE